MSRRRHHRGGHEEGHANDERWLLTYADMITLLLALFIVLFAISTVNQKKFLALALGLKQSFDPKPGVLSGSNGLLKNASLSATAGSQATPLNKPLYNGPAPGPLATPTKATATTLPAQAAAGQGSVEQASSAQLAELQRQIQAALVKAGLASDADLQLQRRGLVVQILADKVFFATGSADLGPVGNEVVDAVASVLQHDTFDIDVEGYTDNQPVLGGQFGSNEELSAVRAVNVVLRLEHADGLEPSRLSATGYGDTRPVAPNDTPAHMALNRRIDVVVLASSVNQP